MSTALTNFTWANWLKDYKRTGIEIARPTTTNELRDCFQNAVDSNKKIRAIGSGHSLSSVSRPHNIAIDTKELYKDGNGRHRVLSNSSLLRRNFNGLNLGEQAMRLSGGVTIKELNRHILAPRNLALINMGNYDGQTLSGAINTATHGTGIRLASLADMVLSVELMTIINECGKPTVKRIRIEPTDGITDPRRFNSQFGNSDFNLLMQNDDLFYSAVASYGCMGIAAAYTIKVTNEYWLKEAVNRRSWGGLKRDMDANVTNGIPDMVSDVRHFSFTLNLAEVQEQETNQQSNPKCLVVRHTLSDKKTKPSGWPPTSNWPPERTGFGEDIQKDQIIDPEEKHEILGSRISIGYSTLAGCTPFKHDKDNSISHIVLRRLRDGKPTNFDETPAGPPLGISADIAVPIDKMQDAIDRVVEFAANETDFRIAVLGVRFVAESNHYLTPMYNRKCAMLEMVIKLTFHHESRMKEVRDDIAKPILNNLEDLLCYNDNFQGIPHIGKHNGLNFDKLNDPKNFPKFSEWLITYQLFNAFGFFDNKFTDQLGLSDYPSNVATGDECIDSWETVVSKRLLRGFFNPLKGKIQPRNTSTDKPKISRRK